MGPGSTWPWNPGLTRPSTQTVPLRGNSLGQAVPSWHAMVGPGCDPKITRTPPLRHRCLVSNLHLVRAMLYKQVIHPPMGPFSRASTLPGLQSTQSTCWTTSSDWDNTVLNVDLRRVWTVRPERGSKCHPQHQFLSASRWRVPMIQAKWERLWIAYHRSRQSWCLFRKKVRGFYRTAWSSHFGQSRNDTGNIISCHAPSILVLVQIPNSTRPKMDPCVPQNSYKTAIIRCPLFSSEASFCQSPGFHSSAMVVSCWEHSQSEFRYGEHTDQHFYLWNWWSRHYFKFNASPTFCYCSRRQSPPFPHRPPTLAVILVLPWAESGDSVNITMSPSYLGMSSGSFTWAEWLICLTFFGKAHVSGLSTS